MKNLRLRFLAISHLTLLLFGILFFAPKPLFCQWEKLEMPYAASPQQLQDFGGILVCHTADGAYKSTDSGASWQFMVKSLCCNGYLGFSFFNPDSGQYFFVDEEEHSIKKSTDSGQTWFDFGQMPLNSMAIDRNQGLFFKGGDIFSFQQKYIAKKQAGGPLNGWSPVLTLDSTGFVFNALILNAHIWAETNQGIYHSPNLGATWDKPFGSTYRRLAAMGDTLLVTTDSVSVTRSTDNGVSWTMLPLPYFKSVSHVFSSMHQFYIMTGDTLYASKTGDNWMPFFAGAYVYNVVEKTGGYCLACTGPGFQVSGILQSMDGGTTFRLNNRGLPKVGGVPTARYLGGILHLSDGLGFSEDDGSSWGNPWLNGSAIAPQNIFRAGNRCWGQYLINGLSNFSPFVCSANGRFEWSQPNGQVIFSRLAAVGDTVFGVSGQALFRTTDGGKNWAQTGSVPVSDFLLGWRGKLFSTDNTKIVFSDNSGSSWQDAYDFGAQLAISTSRFFVSGDTLLFSYPSTDQVFFSKNGGFSFDTISTPKNPNSSIFRLRVFGRTFVLFTDDGEQVHLSHDAGQNWLTIPFPIGLLASTNMDLLTANEHSLVVPIIGNLWRLRFDGLRNIGGSVFFDENKNGAQDNGEPGLKDRIVSASKSGFTAKTRENGSFTIALSNLADTLKLGGVPTNFTVVPTSKPVAANDMTPVIFALQPIGAVHDAATQLVVPAPFRAGFSNTVALVVENKGTKTINPQLRLTLDANLVFASSDLAPTQQTVDSLIWNLPGIPPFGTRTIHLVLKTNPVPPGTPIELMSQTTITQESTPTDNVAKYSGIVVSSFDPNDKAVSRAAFPLDLNQPTELIYTVRFQNLGNAATDFVVILDTLSQNLDPASLQVLGKSHPMNWQVLKGNILECRFSPLFLPPAVLDEAASHGFVQFRVLTKNGLAVGDLIENTASIYFDFNPSVVTNTVATEVKTISVDAPVFVEKTVSIVPNPANGLVKISCEAETGSGILKIFNFSGQLIFESSTNELHFWVDSSRFPIGLCVVYWQVGNRVFSGKMEIAR